METVAVVTLSDYDVDHRRRRTRSDPGDLSFSCREETLANVFAGVEVVAEKTSSVPIVLPSVNESLRPVREFCDAV